MTALLLAAGAAQLGVAVANLFLARTLKLDAEFATLSPLARDIARAHHAYIVGVLFAFGLLCLGFPKALLDGALGAFLSAGLAVFWGARLWLQLFRYDAETRRRYRLADLAFTLTAAALTGIFVAAAARALA